MLKKSMITLIIACLVMSCGIPVSIVFADTQATYYVSPSGNDSNPGTLSQPFQTIQKARDVVRTINSNMTGDIIIYLCGGTYTLTDTLNLDQSDSGTNGYNIIYQNYPGENPIISSETQITGWSLYDAAKSIYKATVPSSLDTRQLYVDGVRAVRAKGLDNPGWSNIVSGIYSSNGYSSALNNVYLTVDLGSTQTVGMVKLYPRPYDTMTQSPCYPVDFTIQVSTDGTNFTTVKTVTNEPNPVKNPKEYSFTSTQARYVKLNVTKLGLPNVDEPTVYRLQLLEIGIYGSGNLALNKTATSNDSWESSGFSVTNLTDGNLSNCYTSNNHSSDSASIYTRIDLGANNTVGAVKLYPRVGAYTITNASPQFPVDYTIQVSTDGTNYTTVKTIKQQANPFRVPQMITFGAVQARYVKVNVTKLGIPTQDEVGNYRLQLSEIEVYTSDNLAEDKTVTSNSTLESAPYFGISNINDGINKTLRCNTSSICGYMNDAGMQNWKNISDIELVMTNWGWQFSRCGVRAIKGTSIYLDQLCLDNLLWLGGNSLKWVENAYELLDSEGEWYLDKTGSVDGTGIPKIYYKPRYGEDMFNSRFTVPTVETLIDGKGTLDNPIHNIQFKGITFQCSTYLVPNTKEGYADTQAGVTERGVPDTGIIGNQKIPSAVSFIAAKYISLQSNLFTHLGAGAVSFEYGSQENSILYNRFEDISGGAVFIGDIHDHHPSDTRAIVKNNTVKDNYFTRIGVEYKDTVPIFAGYTDNSLIEHNEIFNVPYTGISCGWGWGVYDVGGSGGYTTPTQAQNNKIQYNLIQHVNQDLHDGGGIYTLGAQANSTINNNYIRYVADMADASPSTIYPDEATKYYSINNNVLRNIYQWLKMWTSSIQNNVAQYNYSDTSTYWDSGTNNTVSNNTTVTDGNWPAAAQTIMNNAGIESAYISSIKTSPSDNLALGQGVTASSSEEMVGWGVGKLTDGLRDQLYTSGAYTSSNNTVYVTVDLGSSRSIGSVKLYPRAANQSGVSQCYPIDFTIQTSTDGTNFTTAKTITGQANPAGQPQEYSFPAVNARYVKVNVTQLGFDQQVGGQNYYRLQFSEMEVYSPSNKAWGKTVTATNSGEVAPWGAAKLTDGYTSFVYNNTGFTSYDYASPNTSFYVQVDLSSSQSVSSVKLYPRLDGVCDASGLSPNFPVDFTIKVSTDGINYTTVKTVTGQSNPNKVPQEYTFTATNGRYIKVDVTKFGTQAVGDPYYRLQLSEIQVY